MPWTDQVWTEGVPLLGFAASYAALAAVPGTNFLAVSHASMHGRRIALAAAAGVASGAGLLAAVAFIGFAFISPPAGATAVLALIYAGVLLHAGFGCLARRRTAAAKRRGPPLRRPFWFGFAVAALNPVSFTFFAAAAAQRDVSDLIHATGHVSVVFAVALVWFGGMALLLSVRLLRVLHRRRRHVPELGIGLILVALGGVSLFHAAAAIRP